MAIIRGSPGSFSPAHHSQPIPWAPLVLNFLATLALTFPFYTSDVALPPAVDGDMAQEATVAAFQDCFLLTAIVFILALVPALLIRPQRRQVWRKRT